ncbi:MAG TPA: hypothetical protein GXX61_05095 [Bacteroidales bacterium]|jgi:REP element-mobilizing transposase RayT|nr:hypothetical protein [Bacteroidales bacterium]
MWYHISVQGNRRQSIFMNDRDKRHAMDLLAVFSHAYCVKVLAYQFLSNHYHLIVECEDPGAFMQGFRISYTRYFHKVHGTSGSVGRVHFSRGYIKTLTWLEDRLIYVLRNSTKHQVEEHPYADKYNSSRYYFYEARKVKEPEDLQPAGKMCSLMHSKHFIPESYLLDADGHVYPRSFLDYKAVEQVFRTYSSFLHKISTPTEKEIADNKGVLPVPRKASMSDLDISECIMKQIHPTPIHYLDRPQVVGLCKQFLCAYPVSVRQLARVFGLPESSLRCYLRDLRAQPRAQPQDGAQEKNEQCLKGRTSGG